MSVLDRFRLDGKRLFITGGSRGLGREMALAIADVGADCILVGRNEESLNRTANDIRAFGREAITIIGDMGNPTDCERVCNEAIVNHGRWKPGRNFSIST
jgi:short-subunit dehydrogenase